MGLPMALIMKKMRTLTPKTSTTMKMSRRMMNRAMPIVLYRWQQRYGLNAVRSVSARDPPQRPGPFSRGWMGSLAEAVEDRDEPLRPPPVFAGSAWRANEISGRISTHNPGSCQAIPAKDLMRT
jgi:hypothetical protein